MRSLWPCSDSSAPRHPSPTSPPLHSVGDSGGPAYRWSKVKSEAGLSKPCYSEAEQSKVTLTFHCSLFPTPAMPFASFFCQASINPLIFQMSSLLWRSLWPPPLFLGRITINHHLWIPTALLKASCCPAYLIFLDAAAWVLILSLLLTPHHPLPPTPSQNLACSRHSRTSME